MVLNEQENRQEQPNENQYECNICLDTAKDAVVSLCGHLFCWPCLFQWLEARPNSQTCPVCKSAINRDKVIPLYGRNSTNNKDPRDKVPPRPQGQRTEVPRNNGFSNFNFDNFQISFGIGAFPFSLFATTFNIGSPGSRIPPPAPGTPQAFEEQFLSKIFLIIAAIFFFLIVLA